MPIAIQFFVHYAYLILFAWVLAEQLGFPIPSIPVLLTAGTLTATHELNPWLAVISVLAACVAADSMWFLLGRRYGGSVLKLLCRFSMEASTCVAKTEGYFSRTGAPTLLFAKFVPGLSTVAPPIAGQLGMPYRRFLLWDIAGSLIWAEAYLLGGRFFGDLIKKSAPLFHIITHYAFLIFILMVFGFIIYRFVKQRKFITAVAAMRLEPTELKTMIDEATAQGNTPPFIVDLRHPLDYLPDPRVLPGALRIGPNELTQHQEIIPRDRDVVLYCTCPSEETSAKVAMQLHRFGIYRVRPLRGGFDGWKTLGYPLQDYVQDVPTSGTTVSIDSLTSTSVAR
jgi:membrane protein DedA with SNARE-associated domain/rhodanese-related sulfurtransferase